jgi:CTP:molybdopterin cytidylyltransferase MocA
MPEPELGRRTAVVTLAHDTWGIHLARHRIRDSSSGDRRGNPVLWPRTFFPALRALEGDRCVRDLLASNSQSILRIPLENDGVLVDLDTP